jgi:hypothetical protein
MVQDQQVPPREKGGVGHTWGSTPPTHPHTACGVTSVTSGDGGRSSGSGDGSGRSSGDCDGDAGVTVKALVTPGDPVTCSVTPACTAQEACAADGADVKGVPTAVAPQGCGGPTPPSDPCSSSSSCEGQTWLVMEYCDKGCLQVKGFRGF